ncbi:MAG TPA: hypothetical protein PLF32_09020 [Bacteroidales bacterium]|nr:hypothetical protein [Bacteroidales bacterium]HOR82779.1 hypothetical protein [Bacteroidales bacterium]HPJ92025.1 hypothetical protein [Bacteroidales bacterium]
MNKIILSLIFIFSLISCVNNYSKSKYIGTKELGNKLYQESYKVYSGGVFASDSYSYYLTDSINFREYIGTINDDHQNLLCKKLDHQNTVIVFIVSENYQFYKNGVNSIYYDTTIKCIYNIDELIRDGKFE